MLNKIIQNSYFREIETGEWVNISIADNFTEFLDTSSDPDLLGYKNLLLDKNSVIFYNSSSITVANLYIHSKEVLPQLLVKKLHNNPAKLKNAYFKDCTLYLIDDHILKITLNGYFQLAGQFREAEIKNLE